MCLRNTKKHLLSWLLCSILLVSLLFGQLNLGCYASETSSGNEIENAFKYTEDFIRDNFDAICRYTVRWYAIVADSVIGTWEDFTTWLENNNHSDVWEQHPHSPIRVQNGIENVEVPEEVLNIVLNYMEYRIENTDRGYTECYLYSYNFLSPSAFSTYQQYITTKNYLKNSEGRYSVILLSQGNILVSQYLNQSQNLGFVGTTTMGTFTSVQPYVNWQTLGQNMLQPNATINTGGVMTQNVNTNWYGYSNLKNTATPNSNNKIIMSPNEKNELVYVFKTLNAYKNYNAGMPQPYYLTTDGMTNSNWEVGSGTINTGTLSSVNGSYNTTINNVQSGWTADEVLALVDKISGSSGNGSGSDDDDDNPFSFLGDIGDLIKDLVTGVGDLLTDLVGSLVDVVLGEKQEDGTRSGGIIGLITDILSSLTGLINTNIGDFLSAVFGWLPTEFVTIFKAMLIFGIFFSIWKMIRG